MLVTLFAKPATAGNVQDQVALCVAEQQLAMLNAPEEHHLSPQDRERYDAAYGEAPPNLDLEALDAGNLAVICHDLGWLFPDLKKKWPNAQGLFRFRIGPGLESVRDEVTLTFKFGTVNVRHKHGGETFLPVNVFAGVSYPDIRLAGLQAGLPAAAWKSIEAQWGIYCTEPGQYGAFSDVLVIVFCLPGGPEAYDLSSPEFQLELARLFAETLFGAGASQSMGQLPHWHEDRAPDRDNLEPRWLWHILIYYGGDSLTIPLWNLKEQLAEAMGREQDHDWLCPRLADPVLDEGSEQPPFWPALSALIALEEAGGADGLARFYRHLGFTRNWHRSFRAIFGGTPEAVFGCE